MSQTDSGKQPRPFDHRVLIAYAIFCCGWIIWFFPELAVFIVLSEIIWYFVRPSFDPFHELQRSRPV